MKSLMNVHRINILIIAKKVTDGLAKKKKIRVL